MDVAQFLANKDSGLFVFDQSYRPIPLTQKFIGVTEKNSIKRQTLMVQIAYNKACEALRNGKQAMVFVHSRKDTVKTAKQLAEFAAAQDGMELFSNDQHERKDEFAQQVSRSRNNELKEFSSGPDAQRRHAQSRSFAHRKALRRGCHQSSRVYIASSRGASTYRRTWSSSRARSCTTRNGV